MTVPEAALDIDYRAHRGENEVRAPREALGVPAETDAKVAQRAGDRDLRLRTLGSDAGHHLGPLPLGEYVRHG